MFSTTFDKSPARVDLNAELAGSCTSASRIPLRFRAVRAQLLFATRLRNPP
jgi:hypothetical protein